MKVGENGYWTQIFHLATHVYPPIVLTHTALLIHTGYSGVYCMLMPMIFGMYSQPRAKEGKKIVFTIL